MIWLSVLAWARKLPSLLGRIPRKGWEVIGVLAVVALAWVGHARSVAHSYTKGRDDAGREAARLVPAQHDTVRITQARTDTVFVRVTKLASDVKAVGSRVPDTVRVAFPVVDTLVVESAKLADSVVALRADVLTERRAHEDLQVSTARLVVAVSDSLRTEQKRPKRTWRSNTVLTTTGAILGTVVTLLVTKSH